MGHLTTQREQIVADFELRLTALGSDLLNDADTREQTIEQARSILAEVCASLGRPDAAADELGLLLSRQIGSSRAAARVHPSESMLAAQQLIDVVMTAAGECARDLPDPADALIQLSIVLSEKVFHRVRTAGSAYAGFLLEEIRLSNENERRRIARELHDRVSYGMNAAYRQLELAEMYLDDRPDLVRERLLASLALVGGTMETTRQVASGLRLEATSSSLAESLTAYAAPITDSNVLTQVAINGEENRVPENVREEIYMIIRETMRNSLMHAEARHLMVRIDIAPHELRATVEDDGIGFDLEAVGVGGTGMSSMRERTELITGVIRFQSRRGAGTRTELIVPLSDPWIADV